MGLLFPDDEREDFVAMIEEIAERVEDLCLGDAERLGDLEDRVAAPVQRDHLAHGNSQPVDDRLPSADLVVRGSMCCDSKGSRWTSSAVRLAGKSLPNGSGSGSLPRRFFRAISNKEIGDSHRSFAGSSTADFAVTFNFGSSARNHNKACVSSKSLIPCTLGARPVARQNRRERRAVPLAGQPSALP